jgi:hypothetical protein
LTRAARAGIALAAAWFCLGAGSAAFAKSKKHKHHHTTKSRHHQRQQEENGGTEAEGRAHLKRANALADKGDCQSAIDEYTKAYELLNEPALLFNRGECFRRIGDNDPAIDDYREFLEKVPDAPNRAAVEAKIAALEGPKAAARPSVAEARPKSPPPAAPPAVSPAPAPPRAIAPPPPAVSPPPRAVAPPPPAVSPPPAPPPPAVAPPPPVVAQPPPAAPPPAEQRRPEPVVAVQRTAPPAESAPGGGSRPWVWVALTVLAVGAGAAGYLMFRPHDQVPPETTLGNYRF